MNRKDYEVGVEAGLLAANNLVMKTLKGLPKTTERATFDLLLDLSNDIMGSVDKYEEEASGSQY
jgi:hypothetical protein